jgi:FRG domain
MNAFRHFDSAIDFLNSLRRSNPIWLDDGEWEVQWIFRGVADAGRELSPSVWRPSISQHSLYNWVTRAIGDTEIDEQIRQRKAYYADDETLRERAEFLLKQKRFEYFVVDSFMNFVDELGYTIPGGLLPSDYRCFSKPFDDQNVLSKFHTGFALAQHHGVPTRLIDWTFDPMIAAFFAADEENESDVIAVWALNPKGLAGSEYRMFKPERSGLGYLHAQKGLFTYHWSGDFVYARTGKWPRMEQDVETEYLRKLTLSRNQVPELQKLLWAERITRAHLMPTLDNISKCLESNWDRSEKMRPTSN